MKKVLFYCDICTTQVREDVLASIDITIASAGDLEGPTKPRQIEHACRNCRTNLDVLIDRFVSAEGKI